MSDTIVLSKDTDINKWITAIHQIRSVVEPYFTFDCLNNYKLSIKVEENRNFKATSGVCDSSIGLIKNEFRKLDLELQGVLSVALNGGNMYLCRSILISVGNFYPNTVKSFLSLTEKMTKCV